MPEHFPFSPSGAVRWMNCPASWQAEQQYPDEPSGEAAIAGTHTHTLLEHCTNERVPDAVLLIDKEMEDHEGTFTVDLDQALRVNVALQYVRDRVSQLGGDVTIASEQRVNPGAWIGADDMKGTLDLSLVADKTLEIIDYKDGRGYVDPKESEQLGLYMAGKLHDFHRMGLAGQFDNFRLTVVQPKAGGVKTWDTDAAWLTEFMTKVGDAYKAAKADNPPFNPGPKQCKWCKHRGNCEAMSTQALEDVGIDWQQLNVAQQAADKEPAKMSDEQLREFVEAIPLLKQAIKAAEEEGVRRFRSGHSIPGLKVVQGLGNRKYNCDEETMAERLKRMQVPKSVIWQQKLISPTQLAKAVWTKKDGTHKSLSKRQIATLERDYIERPKGALRLVPESEPGDPVTFHDEVMEQFKPAAPAAEELPAWLA